MTSTSMPSFAKLNSFNYPTWAGEMMAWLRAQGVWRIVSGTSLAPAQSSPPTESQIAALDLFYLKSDKAAGYIYLCVEDDQKIHFSGIQDDPVAMWKKLSDVHLQKRPGARFNAYDDLFSIRKKEDESLQSLMNRVDTAVKRIQDLRPQDFDLAKLDNELASMALIRALPEEFANFASSLLLLDKLDKAVIQQAFVTEEAQHCH